MKFKEQWHLYAIIVILIALVAHLASELETSRENEREMSNRLATAVRGK